MNDRPTGPILHPVQVVVRRTGISPELLRTWERRYAVVEPERSPGGRRLYTDDDIDRLRLLRRAIGLGWSIGQVARQPTDALRQLVMGEAVPDRPEERRLPEGPPPVEAPVDECMSAIETLDASALERALSRAVVSVGRSRVVEGRPNQTSASSRRMG